MIVLPDEDEEPVSAQVNAAIGDALRLSVADAEFSPGFEARLAAALDAAGSAQGGELGQADEARDAAGAGQIEPPGQPGQGAAGQGAKATEVAS